MHLKGQSWKDDSTELNVYFWMSIYFRLNVICDVLHNIVQILVFLHIIAISCYRKYIFNPKIEALVRPHIAADCPPLTEIEKRTVLALVNSHPVVNYAEPLPPNVIEVGGLQSHDPKPLPKRIQQFIDDSQKGAILFSMGTNVPPEIFGEKGLSDILKVIEEMSDYNFLWKLDIQNGTLIFPKNLLVEKFLPQSDILSHNKTVAFISHCGGLSTFEATKYGVPIIGVPFFIDQFRNLRKAITDGAAVELPLKEFNARNLKSKVLEVLKNPAYSENMKKRSKRLNDQPNKPLERAVWWIEYILRNPEPDHLLSPAIDMGYFAAYSFDVIGLFLITFLLVLFFIWMKIFKTKCTKCNKIKKN